MESLSALISHLKERIMCIKKGVAQLSRSNKGYKNKSQNMRDIHSSKYVCSHIVTSHKDDSKND